MPLDQEKYELPEPAGTSKEPEFEIEIESDTPAVVEDKAPEKEAKTVEPDKESGTSDEDLEQYGEKVQKRIKKLTRGYHEAQREREEAIRVATLQQQRIATLEQQLTQGTQIVVDQVKTNATMELDAAKKAFKAAYEAGDADALADAQDAITEAKIKLREAQQYKAPLQTREHDVQIQQSAVPAPSIDHKAVEWQENNSWFMRDPEMTSYALGLDKKLRQQGVDPRSDEYYEAVDARMRKMFPEHDWGDKPEPEVLERQPEHKKPKSVVAPATRSAAPKKVTLTPTQVALAKRMNIPLEVYAREWVKQEMEANNG